MRYHRADMESSVAGTPDDTHLAYLRRLLEGVARGDAGGEFLYITRTEGKPGFWELLGFRVRGMPRCLVGAVHFHAQNDDPLVFARRSLGHFLSSPPQTMGHAGQGYPADLIELRVSLEGESPAELLGRLRRGEPTASLFLDAAQVEVAFDFRPANPSLQRASGPQVRPTRLLFRSREGHLLVGDTLNLGAKLRRGGGFLALTGVVQHLPGRELPLPTLVIHREFLTMMTDSADDGEPDKGDGAGAGLPGAFTPESGNPSHVLDPRLDTGTASG